MIVALRKQNTEMAGVRGEMGGIRGEMTTMRWMLGFLVALAVANFAKQYF
jgi:hypothetical protein